MTEKRGLQIHSLEQQAQDAARQLNQALTADRRLWLNADRTKLVEDGDTEAAWLLAAPGHRIQADDAKRLGLHMHEGRIEQDAHEPSSTEKAPTDEKKSAAKEKTPGENKQRQSAENK